MLVIQNTLLCTKVFKFAGFDSMYICKSEDLNGIIQATRCCMVIRNPSSNAFGFLEQFLRPLHILSLDYMSGKHFSKIELLNIAGQSLAKESDSAISQAYEELSSAIKEYTELLMDSSKEHTIFRNANYVTMGLKEDEDLFLVVPTIVSKNSVTGKKSFRILDTAHNKVADMVEYINNYYFVNEKVQNKLSSALYGSNSNMTADHLNFRLIRTVRGKLSSFLGYLGITPRTILSLYPEPDKCRHTPIHNALVYSSRVTIPGLFSRKHDCTPLKNVYTSLGLDPFDSEFFSYCSKIVNTPTKHITELPLEVKEYINGDEVVFYTQVVSPDSITYETTSPCQACPNFMGRVSTSPRCTFMSYKCNKVEYSESGLTAWKNIKFSKE